MSYNSLKGGDTLGRGARSSLVSWLALAALSGPLQGQERTVRVSGTVTDATSGLPIEAVSVWYDGNVVTVTDSDGRFETPRLSVRDAQVTLFFQRIGYAALSHVLEAPPLRTELDLHVTLEPLPTTLETIVVEGAPIVIRNPGLVGFYNRREEGFGRYLTEAQIDRAKSWDLTPHMRRLMLGVTLATCNRTTPLVVFVDGIRYPGFDAVNAMLPPSVVGGVEVYTNEGVSRLPNELIPAGPICGVVHVWTRAPKGASSVEVAGQLSGQFTGETRTIRFLGGRVVFPLRSRSTLHLHLGLDANLERQGERWYLSVVPALKPFGRASPWYIGTGVAIGRRDVPIVFHHAVLTGLTVGSSRLKPFVEFRLLDPLRPRDAVVIGVTGVRLQFGPRNDLN